MIDGDAPLSAGNDSRRNVRSVPVPVAIRRGSKGEDQTAATSSTARHTPHGSRGPAC
jgi:hypothetical protein